MDTKNKIHVATEVKDFELKKVLNSILHKLQNIDDVLIDVVRLQERANTQARTLSIIEERLENYDRRIHKTEIDQAALRNLETRHKSLSEDVRVCSKRIDLLDEEKARDEGAWRVIRYVRNTVMAVVIAVITYKCTEG